MSGSLPDLPKARTIAIAATFTAEPILGPLDFWMQQLGMPAAIEFAPYNQIFQQLIDPFSLFARNNSGINVVLVRVDDLAPQFERNARDLIQALDQGAQRPSVPLLVCLCPASPLQNGEPDPASLRVQGLLSSELASLRSVHLITNEELMTCYPVAFPNDEQYNRLARVPYTPIFFSALGTMIARKIHALTSKPYKVIALDCDQTLWSGICGEDGPREVRISPEFKAFQEFMVRQQSAGMLLCLCSKNNEEDVAAVFECSDMPLKREHLVSWRINWLSKSENLRSLATELHLALDSFIFVDDDPVECAEVRASCPEVLTLQLPRGSREIPGFLKHVWAFDHPTTTAEDRKRTALYRQDAQRSQGQKQFLTFADFLESLDLRVDISPLSQEEFARASELTYRTNQFNFAPDRRSEEELQSVSRLHGMNCFGVRVLDRFGDYGLVGLIVFQTDSWAIRVETFLLSCRAMGKGVEYQMLASLGQIALERGLDKIELHFVPTLKNRRAQEFLESLAKDQNKTIEQGRLLAISAHVAAVLRYVPAIEEAAYEISSSQAATESNASLLSFIASELADVEEIHKAIGQRTPLPAESRPDFVEPQTPLEKKVAAVWCDILGIDRIGRNENFFTLGGHSLLAMQILSRVCEAFDVELSPGLLFDDFTIAGLAKAILTEQIRQAGRGDVEAILGKLIALSDDEVRILLDLNEKEEIEHTIDNDRADS